LSVRENNGVAFPAPRRTSPGTFSLSPGEKDGRFRKREDGETQKLIEEEI
jgi:hypothetical protein